MRRTQTQSRVSLLSSKRSNVLDMIYLIHRIVKNESVRQTRSDDGRRFSKHWGKRDACVSLHLGRGVCGCLVVSHA